MRRRYLALALLALLACCRLQLATCQEEDSNATAPAYTLQCAYPAWDIVDPTSGEIVMAKETPLWTPCDQVSERRDEERGTMSGERAESVR